MRKKVLLLVFLLFTAFLSAADIDSDSETKKFYPQLNIGFGADFSGKPGIIEGLYSNRFGLTAGLDLKWRVLQQTDGDLFMGFGFDFQYWVPTATASHYDTVWPHKYADWPSVSMNYIRIPVILKIFYAFKVDAGVLVYTGPEFSIGINNNFFFFDYCTANSEYDGMDDFKRYFDDSIHHWKISGTWAIGLNFIFNSPWIFKISLGGDFGSQDPKSELFNPYYSTDNEEKSYLNYILYSHHEFMMFETGYRF